MAHVQRRRDGRRAPLPRAFLSNWPGLPPWVARATELRVPPPPPDASGDPPLPLRPHLLSPLPLGPPLPGHALRSVATEASDRADRRPVLWRRRPGNAYDCLSVVDHPVANGT